MRRDNKVLGMGSKRSWKKKVKGIGKLWGIKVELRYDVGRDWGGRSVVLWKGVGIERVRGVLGDRKIKRREI